MAWIGVLFIFDKFVNESQSFAGIFRQFVNFAQFIAQMSAVGPETMLFLDD